MKLTVKPLDITPSEGIPVSPQALEAAKAQLPPLSQNAGIHVQAANITAKPLDIESLKANPIEPQSERPRRRLTGSGWFTAP